SFRSQRVNVSVLCPAAAPLNLRTSITPLSFGGASGIEQARPICSRPAVEALVTGIHPDVIGPSTASAATLRMVGSYVTWISAPSRPAPPASVSGTSPGAPTPSIETDAGSVTLPACAGAAHSDVATAASSITKRGRASADQWLPCDLIR